MFDFFDEVFVVPEIKLKPFLLSMILVLALPVIASADLESPVENGVVTSGVGWRLDPFGTGKRVFHRGIDIAVPVGTPVHATRKGRVIFAGDHHGHGSTIILEHDNGDRTLYGHNSALLVHVGETVESGTVVALSGSTGRSTGPHVHFERQPSGRPYLAEKTETAKNTISHPVEKDVDKKMLEKQMDDSVNSILKAINRSIIDEHGG